MSVLAGRGRACGLLVGDARDGHQLVAVVERDAAHALRGAADHADLAGLGAHDLAVLGDQHDLVVVAHAEQVDDRPVALARADVDQALAAAALHPVLVDLRALAVAVLAARQQRLGAVADDHVDDLVAVLGPDAPDAGGAATHRPHVGLGEADRHAGARAQDDRLADAAQVHADRLVALLEADGDDAARARPAV